MLINSFHSCDLKFVWKSCDLKLRTRDCNNADETILASFAHIGQSTLSAVNGCRKLLTKKLTLKNL